MAVGAGGEGAERDGGGHESTRSALQCRESLPFAASASMWCRAQRREKERRGELRRAGATCLVVAVLGISGRTSTRAWEDDDSPYLGTLKSTRRALLVALRVTRLGLVDSSQLPRLNVAGTVNGSVQVVCRDSVL